VTRLLRALAAERPTVIVFEDFHWADRSSVQLLESLLPLAADCAALFVCALRPGFPETAGRLLTVAAEQHAERHLRLDLGPIAATATRRLLRGLFRDGELPAPACASIEARAGGNPFFLQEVLRGLLDAGALHRDAAGLQLDPGVGEIVVPGTVQEVILARIDRLPAAARELIQIASVIGRSFPRAVAAALVGADAELEGALSALVDAELLEPSDRHARGFTFRHPLIQEVSYDSILRTKRAELHLRVAGAVETSLREGFPGFEAMLAYHFSRGGDLARAEAHVYRAGEEAARLAAADEAIHFFEAASAIYFRLHGSGDPGKRAALSRNLALCHCNRGDFETAIEHFDRALRELGERVPRRLPARAVRAARAFPKVLLALAFPERTRRRLRRKPAPTPTQRAVLELMALRERAEVVGAPARYPLDNLLAWERFLAVNPAGVPQAAGTAVGGAALLATGGVSFALARRCLELAQDFADPDDVGEQFGLRLARFFYHYLEGDWSDRHEIEDSLVEQALGHGSLWDVSLYLGLEAARKTAQGQFMAAREPLARLEKIADSYRYDLARLNQKGWSAFLCLERRRLPEALSAYADLAERREHTGNLVGVLGGRALAERLAGEPNAARETLREIEGILGRGEFVVPAIRCYYLVARALDHVVALEEIPARGVAGAAARRRARLSTRRALRTARWVASIRPQARRLDARWRWLSGDIPGALRSLERGLVDASRLGMEPESGRIHAELALRLADARSPARSVGGCDRDAHSDAAAQIFRRLGLAWDLERLEAGVAPDTPDRR
jgi:tetratricopeptide (TPR) repeat protein